MTNAKTILVVEDNDISRKMMTYALRTKGFNVLEARDGATAEARMGERPHLVLLDLVLGDTDGFRLADRLRAIAGQNAVPIIACSGFVSKLEEAQLSATNFDDVIIKPIEPSRLVQIVRAHLPAETPTAKLGGGRVVLVVDDDPIQLKLAMHRLARAGFDVMGAPDGAAALESARKIRPSAILSDVMMPVLDGFALCQAVRNDPELCSTPLVLTTNTYVEVDDRELAKRVGADDLVIRTPELREAIDALVASLEADTGERSSRPVMTPAIERERTQRVFRQLEKQVALNSALMQRCAALSAELSVLSGISGALTEGDDVSKALDAALAACLDAGGVSRGALYVFDGVATNVRSFGEGGSASLESFFGDLDALRDLVTPPRTRVLAHENGSGSVLVPLTHAQEVLGALLLVMSQSAASDPDRVAFAESVANQIALALVLARSFNASREQATLLRSILDSIGDAVLAIDAQGRVTHMNHAARTITKTDLHAGDPLFATDLRLLNVDRTTPLEQTPLARALRGEHIDRSEMFMQHTGVADGTWLSANARPVRGDGDAIRGAVAIFRDVSGEKKAQSQLMISDRLASVGMLAAGVAHEINNPLAAVLANIQCAEEDVAALETDPSARRMTNLVEELRDAHEAADRVRHIVRDLKLFSRVDDDHTEPVDLQRVIESTLRMAWNEVRHRATIKRTFGANLPRVKANESRLGQVFLNLVINAAQSMEQGAADRNSLEVRTRLDEKSGRVVVDFIDTGCGMAPEALARLFTPFFTTKPRGVGTGLGLSICQRIVESLGGEIQVESALGKGSTFSVCLLPTTTEDATTAPPSAVVASTTRARVMLIDDDEAITKTIPRTIAEHDVRAFSNGRAALDALRDGADVDVILCDVMMPVTTGVDFYNELAARLPAQTNKVVFVTGGVFSVQMRTFLDTVPNEQIDKPFDPALLRAIIERYARRRA